MAKNNKTRFFYVLYSDKTWGFDQSERAYYPICIINIYIYIFFPVLFCFVLFCFFFFLKTLYSHPATTYVLQSSCPKITEKQANTKQSNLNYLNTIINIKEIKSKQNNFHLYHKRIT